MYLSVKFFFAGNVNEFAALYLMVYKPLADLFFQVCSKRTEWAQKNWKKYTPQK